MDVSLTEGGGLWVGGFGRGRGNLTSSLPFQEVQFYLIYHIVGRNFNIVKRAHPLHLTARWVSHVPGGKIFGQLCEKRVFNSSGHQEASKDSRRVWQDLIWGLFYKRNTRTTDAALKKKKIQRLCLWVSYKVTSMRMFHVSHFQTQQEAVFWRSNQLLNVGIKYCNAVKVSGVSKKVSLKVGAVMQRVYGNRERISLPTCHMKILVRSKKAPSLHQIYVGRNHFKTYNPWFFYPSLVSCFLPGGVSAHDFHPVQPSLTCSI